MIQFRFLRAVQAQLASLTPEAGRLVMVTDTQLLFLGDGSQWLQVGTRSVDVQSLIDDALAGLGVSDINGLVAALADKISTQDLADVTAAVATTASKADLDALTTQAGTKVSQTDIDASIAVKADQSTVAALATEAGKKADAAALTSALTSKADEADLAALTATAATKGDADDFEVALHDKADDSDLDALRTGIPTKAKKTDLANLKTTVDGKIATTALTTALAPKADKTALFDGGLVKSSLLPSSVDDVVEFMSLTNFPGTGEKGKIYVADDTNLVYRWSGTAYVNLASPVIQRLATEAEAMGLTDAVDPMSPKTTGVVLNMVGLTQEDGKWTANEGIITAVAVKGYAKLNSGPSARNYHTLTAIGQKLYLYGGYATADLGDLWVYDIASNTWAAAATPPSGMVARRSHVAVAAGGMLYIVGGYTTNSGNMSDVWQYNPTTKAWTQKASLPTAMSGHGAFKATYNSEEVIYVKTNVGAYLRYVPSTNTWTSVKTGLSTELGMGIALGSDGVVYSYGGAVSSAASGLEYSYVLATGVQTTLTPPTNNPGPKYYANLVAGGSKMYLRGSGPTNTAVSNDLWEFTPATKVWRRLRGAGPEVYLGAMEYANGMLYAFGGITADGTRTNQFWRIDVSQADAAGFGRIVNNGTLSQGLSNYAGGIGGGYIHMFAGSNGNTAYSNTYRWYNLSTKAQGASTTVDYATYAGGVYNNGKFYALAGLGNAGAYNNTLRAFTPASSTVATLTALPGTLRTQVRLAAPTTNLINAMGGYLNAGSVRQTNLHYQYNITTNAWTLKANMPYAANGHAVGAYNGKVYLAGGYDGTGNRDDFYEYDPATDKWTKLTSMPGVAVWVGGTAIGNYFVVGAIVNSLLTLYMYNFTTKTWSTMNTSYTARWTPEFLAGTDGLWIVGGCSVAPGTATYETASRFTDMIFLPLQ